MATTVEVLREYGVAIRANGQKHRPEKVKAQIVTQSLKLGATVNAVAVRALGELDLSRICAAPSARLSHLPFKSDRTLPSQC